MALNPVIEQLSQKTDYLKANWALHPSDAMFLYLLALIGGSQNILEIGTSIGFSTLHLAQAAKENQGRVTSIDADRGRQEQARSHLLEAGLAAQVTLLEGDALSILGQLITARKQFDFLFLDARKSEYIDYFHCAEKLLTPKGLLVADNVCSHRDSMLDFIHAVTQAESWDSTELSTPNGLIISRRKSIDHQSDQNALS